ncbi:hypothetical protein ACN47E_001138 [Coniothyrium glycines]
MSTPNTTATKLPGYEAVAAPPPYEPSDTYSVTSTKSTSKSILAKLFNRNSSESSSSQSSSSRPNEVQRWVEEKEAKHAARASYFAMQ